MQVRVTLERNDLGPLVERYAGVMRKERDAVVLSTAKGATRRVIDLTPPAHNGIVGAAAYRYGREKITRDMKRVLVPVKLKGRRKITTVFGRRLSRPVYVETREMFPNVADTYRRYRRFRNSGVGVRSKNLGERKYWVDARKFRGLVKAKEARVGRLASGWAAGAIGLDVPLQNWIARHGQANGRVVIQTAKGYMAVRVQNFAPRASDNVREELGRRIRYALHYQAGAMERAMAGYRQRMIQEGRRR